FDNARPGPSWEELNIPPPIPLQGLPWQGHNPYLQRGSVHQLIGSSAKSHPCAVAGDSLQRIRLRHERKRFWIEPIPARDRANSSFDAATRDRARRKN